MRKTFGHIFVLFAAIMSAATFTACSHDDKPFIKDDATQVTDEEQLHSAITDGASILLGGDIRLSSSTLVIAEGTTVSINLGGHTLDRGLEARDYDTGGQVITVRKGATLHLSNGTLTGGWSGDGGGLVNEGGTVHLKDVNITGCKGDDRAGGISNHGVLTMEGGSISGNVSNDREHPRGGGGLFNYKDATATLTGVTITGNKAAIYGGGGICNFGTLTIDGCTLTGNTADTYGGGIWQEGTLNMQGAVTINDNQVGDGMTDNIYLKKDALITVTGSLEGSSIGVTLEKNSGPFTSGYSSKNSGVDPSTLFRADLSGVMGVSLDDNSEAQLTDALPEGSVYYIERSWDDASMALRATVKTADDAVVLGNSGGITLTKKHYVVKGSITIGGHILIKPEDGESVGIILCDGARLKTNYSMVFDQSTTKARLHIYGQADDSGKLDMSDNERGSFVRIGNAYYKGHDTEGEINIHGGNLDVNGNYYSPAIGSYSKFEDGGEESGSTFYYAKSGVVNIYGGTVKAYGGTASAGIGSGVLNNDCGTINIYGGKITSVGRFSDELYQTGGAGIGGGQYCYGGTVNICGGNISAVGADEAAGIGCGEGDYWGSDDTVGPGNIKISGGTISAQGGSHGAGIGKGDGTDGPCNITISGGNIIAKGGTDAAGIGGGEGSPGGHITISGGYVEAHGNDYGAGLGGGQDGAGGKITITGGTVVAKAGRNETGWRAIGPGSGSDDYGSLTLGDNMMVLSGDGKDGPYPADSRRDHCWYRTQARIEVCTHPGYTAETCPYHKH